MRRPLIGPLLIAIAALHTAVAAALYGGLLAAMARDGLVDSLVVDGARADDRAAAFWFTVAGLACALTGVLALQVERTTGVVPPSFGWGLTALGVLGVVVVPVSGFWTVLAVGVLAVVRARRPALVAVG